MIREKALKFLGLDTVASELAIHDAVRVKREQLQQKRDAAPTEALKAKFDKLLTQLEDVNKLLQTPLSGASSGPSLSQTKLADLPAMDAASSGLNLQPGLILAGRYEIKAQIGAGGMGAVYSAFDTSMSRDIAIKVLLPELFKNPQARERFLNEARISQQLSHPNIVNVFDVQNDGDVFFLTMELLEGQDLRQLMENRKLARQPFTVEEVQDVANAIGAALTYAHQYTVHRDLKPENIWLTDSGVYKLMDFGIAQVQSTSQRTKTGAAMGTAYYMAPEQLKGQKDIDGRADQYALAVLVYELLSGEVPAGRIEPLHELDKTIPKAISAIVDKGLAARPDNRYASIEEFTNALTTAKAPKRSRTKTSRQLDNASSSWPWVVAAALVLLIGGGLLGTGTLSLTDLKNLLPASKAEIAAQKANVAKAQGEIKVYKQRLENGRRQLDSDVRDAQRNKDNNLAALQHWQQLTENGIFSGSQITELEGELSMAETLLRENAFEAAQAAMDKVSAGYKQLWEEFNAAELLYETAQKTAALNEQWQRHAASYQVSAPSQTNAAEAEEKNAKTAERSGEFSKAKSHYTSAQQHWQSAFEAVAGEVVEVKQQRQQAADKLAAERQRRVVAVYVGELVTIPAGSFRMGDTTGNGDSDEKPVHGVTIKAFKMQAHEVTWAQYQPCIDAGACPDNRGDGGDNGWGKGNRPVIEVSWNDITQHYIPWLNKATGQRFRLPTEAEWEYAARAGSTTDYPWGNTASHTYANYGLDKCCGGYASGKDQWAYTAPVKSFAPNAWGLYDMHGNVHEWVQDCWNGSYSGAPTNGSAWLSGDCGKRVLRGSSWFYSPYFLRSANRFGSTASDRGDDSGFRLVQDL